MRHKLKALFQALMASHTMYVLPFSMGPVGSPMAQYGIEFTDWLLRRGQHAHHGAHRCSRCCAWRDSDSGNMEQQQYNNGDS